MKLPLLRTFEDREAEENERHMEEVRVARLAFASEHWSEIPEPVARSFGWLIDVDTDFIFTLRRGVTFDSGKASIFSGQGVDLWFYIDDAGWPVVLERVKSPGTYTEHLERRARRAAR